jgi:hypothetical protein
MMSEEFRRILLACDLRQSDAAWLCGVHPRQVRAWVNGEDPVPQYASLLLSAYAEGLLPAKWLASHIEVPPP